MVSMDTEQKSKSAEIATTKTAVIGEITYTEIEVEFTSLVIRPVSGLRPPEED